MSWTPGEAVRLETARFVVRSLGLDDVSERWARWTGDPEIMWGIIPTGQTVSRADLVQQVRGFDNRSSFILGVFCKQSALHVGVYRAHCDLENLVAETTVVIGDRDYWGQNVVVETRDAVLDFLFDAVRVEKVYGTPFARNLPAVFNYKAQGFTCEGVIRKHRRLPDGKRLDMYYFGMLREEWLARRSGQRE